MRKWRLGVLASLACLALLALLALLAAACLAGGAAGESECGQVAVGPGGAAAFWSLNEVQAEGVSCAAARALVRSWSVAARANHIPQRVVYSTGANHVLVIGRYGAPYRFDGFTCRWMNTSAGKSAYQPGRGMCTSSAGLVSWTYHGALNPSVGSVKGCGPGIGWKHGGITGLRVRGLDCASAERTVRYALNHGAVRAVGGGFAIVHRVVRGFRFAHTGISFTATKGDAEITFSLCWYNVDC